MEDIIPYDLVTTKLNFWYTAIKNNLIKDAVNLKKEIDILIKNMEENQDVLLYYQLLNFRHDIMLSYMTSKSLNEIKESHDYLNYLKKKKKNMNQMLEYYFYYFMGMYEFRRKELTTAITAYRRAEQKLAQIDDEIEHAEFFFKVSEVYYYMKQTYFSLNYAKRALRIYMKKDTYADRIIHVQCIIAGNYFDILDYSGALKMFEENLNISKEIQKKHLIGTSHMNIGICSISMKEYDKAEHHLRIALKILEEEKHSFLTKALFNMCLIKFKKNQLKEAKQYLKKGQRISRLNHDQEYLTKFMILQSLYLKENKELLHQCFDFLKKRKMFADIEEYSLEVADFFYEKGNYEASSEYYRIMKFARDEIKKGEMMNENHIDAFGATSTSGRGYIRN
ncbi:tetratricopeptide repeat protein [Bacillus sp. NPDC093026]|uniref:response regulator aspartate phosphatase n=1 Tax=Bacillus sp. NPDC093026 TaxID=3363948 RepID=UPI00382004BE